GGAPEKAPVPHAAGSVRGAGVDMATRRVAVLMFRAVPSLATGIVSLERPAEALRLGINRKTLYAMRDAGVVEPVSRGVYRLASLESLAHPACMFGVLTGVAVAD